MMTSRSADLARSAEIIEVPGRGDRVGRREGDGLRSSGAFTLIELLVVLAIVAVVSALVVGLGNHANNFAQMVRAKAELAAVSAALESYRRQYGDYPHTNRPDELLQALIGKRAP